MTEVREVKLPGVGVLHNFTTTDGRRLGVVTHRTGHRELLVYREGSTDDCSDAINLSDDDERILGELLGGSKVTEETTKLQTIEGLAIDWLQVGYSSACAGSAIGHPELLGDKGVMIVAVIRGDETFPSPPPDFRLWPGDTAVAVGTPEGVQHAFAVLRGD
ncbi:cation:proton antiporter regulatory subunit [soil metagenome]|jgi:TrkA domain protein